MHRIVLIMHNVRSTHNVGSLLRTAEGLGVEKVYMSGYTPYPMHATHDKRLPHEALKLDRQIHKTALGAEQTIAWEHCDDIFSLLASLRQQQFTIAAVEQDKQSQALSDFNPHHNVALLVGREVEGIEPKILEACDIILEIPMLGQKESFNVTQAAAMAIYHTRYLAN